MMALLYATYVVFFLFSKHDQTQQTANLKKERTAEAQSDTGELNPVYMYTTMLVTKIISRYFK